MSDQTPDQNLHLPSLFIKNFRGIDELTIPRLGRVTLLTGKNGVGKTTVLDAVRIWAARGHRLDIAEVLHNRDEVIASPDDQGKDVTLVNWDGLFFGRRIRSDASILIGSTNQSDFLQMQIVALDEDEIPKVERRQPVLFDDEEVLALRIKISGFNPHFASPRCICLYSRDAPFKRYFFDTRNRLRSVRTGCTQ